MSAYTVNFFSNLKVSTTIAVHRIMSARKKSGYVLQPLNPDLTDGFSALQVVHLASDSFHYRFNDRCKIHMRRFATEQWPDTIGKRVSNDLPLKVSGCGFVYEESSTV